MPKPLNISQEPNRHLNNFHTRVQELHLQDNPAKRVAPSVDNVPAEFQKFLNDWPIPTGRYRRIDVNVIVESMKGVIALTENFQLDSTSDWPEDIVTLIKQRVRRLRLLGCNTAYTELGWKAMKALSKKLGVEVLGTKTMISEGHFDRIGLKRAGLHSLLWSSNNNERPKVNQCRWLARHGKLRKLHLDQVIGTRRPRLQSTGTRRSRPQPIFSLSDFPGGFEKLRWYRVDGVHPIPISTIGLDLQSRVIAIDVIPGGTILRVHTKDKGALFAAVSDDVAESLARI